jgi:nucleoside-diphosphate-sugar epimerase
MSTSPLSPLRVFVTGASGFIGSAVVPELLAAGHQVTALARSDASATALAAAGARALRGSLDDLESLRAGAAAADGVIHLAFGDFSDGPAAGQTDLHAIEAMAAALQGTGRPLVTASGLLGLPAGRAATEQDVVDPASPVAALRPGSLATPALATRGVRSSVVRLAPSVHGEGDHALVPQLIAIARRKGVSGYVGDGSGRWPAVHRLDAARLFRLALEQAPAGSTLHAVAEEGVPTRDIAESIARHLAMPTVSIPPEQAAEHFGWLGMVFGADIPATSTLTRQLLGWQPVHPGLIEDLDKGRYFDTPGT